MAAKVQGANSKMVTFMDTSATANTDKDTKNYILSNPLPDKISGKGLVFITNDGQVYLNKARLAEMGIERANQIRNVHVRIEIEKV
jgi:hypothetical protein